MKSILPVLAVDLGGTHIRAAVVNNSGQLLFREATATLAEGGPSVVIERIISVIDRLLSINRLTIKDFSAVSISAAGAIDMDAGVVTYSPNLPGWRDIPLREMLQNHYHLPTYIIHDANAAVLAEHRYGAGKSARDIVYLTVSTGIGAGFILNGELYAGATGGAGEVGHMTVDMHGPRCTCGNYGCLEFLASGTAIARDASHRIEHGEQSSLQGILTRDGKITAEDVSRAADTGDALASEVITQAAKYLGAGLTNIVNIFNPEMIIIGGGVARMGDKLLNPARQIVMQRAFPQSARTAKIVATELWDDVGLIGAAVYAFKQLAI